MKSNRQSSIWPYLGILLCLFVLSLAATRTWQRMGTTTELADNWQDDDAPFERSTTAPDDRKWQISTRGPSTRSVPDRTDSPAAAESTPHASAAQTLAFPEPAPHEAAGDGASTSEATLAEPSTAQLDHEIQSSAASDASVSDNGSERETPHAGDSSPVSDSAAAATDTSHDVSQATATDTPSVRVSDSNDRLAMIPRRGARPEMRTPREVQSPPATTAKGAEAAEWNGPRQLLALLEVLSTHEATAKWAFETANQLRQLDSVEMLTGDEGPAKLDRLKEMSKAASQLAAGISTPGLKTQLVRAQYALNRRIEVWEAAREKGVAPRAGDDLATSSAMSEQLREVAALTRGHAQGEAWRKYLLLDSLRRVADQSEVAADNEKRELARRVLARLASARLSQQQQKFVHEGAVAALDASLRRWAAEPVDRRELLANIEAYEEHGRPSTARLVAHQFQTLSFSPEDADRELAEQAAKHYRNANVRIVISNQLMNRFLPAQRPIDSEVNDQIMGAQVEGYSRTITRLSLRLLPDQGRIRLALQATGNVSSDTSSASGPAIFHNSGRTSFVAQKEILAGQSGLVLYPATANASSRSDLMSLDTDYDDVPFVRSFVRSIAESRHNKSQGQAMSEVEQRVAETACARLDAEVAKQAAAAQGRFTKQFLTPLKKLALEPAPLEMSSSAERIVLRFRLASDQQLGAHNARPQAPADSLASVQMHESALNNILEQLELNGRTFDLPELFHALGKKFDRPVTIPDDLPDDVTVTFAAENALQVRCSGGRLELIVAIDELRQPNGRYRNLRVRAYYRPESAGLRAELVRDGAILLEGKSLSTKDQIVLRGVFAKVLGQSRHPQLIGSELASDPRFKGLRVSQLVIDDGWVGLAFSPEPRLVRKPAGVK